MQCFVGLDMTIATNMLRILSNTGSNGYVSTVMQTRRKSESNAIRLFAFVNTQCQELYKLGWVRGGGGG